MRCASLRLIKGRGGGGVEADAGTAAEEQGETESLGKIASDMDVRLTAIKATQQNEIATLERMLAEFLRDQCAVPGRVLVWDLETTALVDKARVPVEEMAISVACANLYDAATGAGAGSTGAST